MTTRNLHTQTARVAMCHLRHGPSPTGAPDSRKGETMEVTKAHSPTRAVRRIAIVVLALAALIVPTTAVAGAEQIVITLVDEPAPWEFDDPCTGTPVHGIGIENGFVKITELGAQGHHVQVRVDGRADLYDDEDNFVGTWTYTIRFGDQFPPDGQGAVSFQAVGPLEYADGSHAVITIHGHTVFDKGDTVKHEFEKASCR